MTSVTIQRARKMLGMTQRELGARLSMTVQQISNYENGRSPVPRVVEMAVMYLFSQEFFDESVFAPDWNRGDMEAYNAL